jgi:hypothetical protein
MITPAPHIGLCRFARVVLASLLALPVLTGRAPAAESTPPPSFPAGAERSPLTSYFVHPTRVVWTSGAGEVNTNTLLKARAGQAALIEKLPPLVLPPGQGIVLDFGVELAGSIELFTPPQKPKKPAHVRVRFGESVAEAMAELGERDAQNDHALRDLRVQLPWLGKTTVGPSGFRFVRIDNPDSDTEVRLSQVRAVATLRDLPYLGSFKSSNPRLDAIWATGAYTVHLNMQDYLWDGIKRDRLVWVGDMMPEVAVINAVFGQVDVVPRSLDFARDLTPPGKWMNDIGSYSMWWILLHETWYQHHGDLAYLRAQQPRLADLLRRLDARVGADGRENINGMRFLDWPTYADKAAVHEGLQALLILTMDAGARLSDVLGDTESASLARATAARLRLHQPPASGRKAAAALMVLAGLGDAKELSRSILQKNGPSDLSTFYGYFVLEALAQAGDIDVALDFISHYWGGMLDQGATTFWEDFDLNWTKNAGRIDELVPPGKADLHGDFGAYCYRGFRHSLCHGWAGGPTAWLSRHVLGISPAAPGFTQVRIEPRLGSLAWAEGTYPTPRGVIRVRHERQPDGTIRSTVSLPPGVERVH